MVGRRGEKRIEEKRRKEKSKGEGDETVPRDLDALPVAGCVAVRVRTPGTVILHEHTLNRHSEGCVTKISFPARPLNDAFRLRRIATSPNTQSQIHGCLRKVLTTDGVSIEECPSEDPINKPFDRGTCPHGRVVVEVILRVVDAVVDCAVVARRVAFAEIVCLDRGSVAADEFPVYFVEVVGFEDD